MGINLHGDHLLKHFYYIRAVQLYLVGTNTPYDWLGNSFNGFHFTFRKTDIFSSDSPQWIVVQAAGIHSILLNRCFSKH